MTATHSDESGATQPAAGALPGHWYAYELQFEDAMREAAIRIDRGQRLMGGGFWTLAICLTIAGTYFLAMFMPNTQILLVPVYIGTVGMATAIGTRTNRLIRRIVAERLCLRCGYPLLHAPVDEKEFGACPECGRRFNLAEYRRPPRRIHRVGG